MKTLNVYSQWEFKKIRGRMYLIVHHFEGGYTRAALASDKEIAQERKRLIKSMRTTREPKHLTQTKKAGLKVTDIDPAKDAKLSDFMELTEGNKTPIEVAYQKLGVGASKPTNTQLKKRYDAARKRLRKQGLL